MKGSRDISVLDSRVILSCISQEARDLLDTIVAEYNNHYEDAARMGIKLTEPDEVYGAFYWLVRHSGLVSPKAD